MYTHSPAGTHQLQQPQPVASRLYLCPQPQACSCIYLADSPHMHGGEDGSTLPTRTSWRCSHTRLMTRVTDSPLPCFNIEHVLASEWHTGCLPTVTCDTSCSGRRPLLYTYKCWMYAACAPHLVVFINTHVQVTLGTRKEQPATERDAQCHKHTYDRLRSRLRRFHRSGERSGVVLAGGGNAPQCKNASCCGTRTSVVAWRVQGHAHAVGNGVMCVVLHRLQEEAVVLNDKEEDDCLLELITRRRIVAVLAPPVLGEVR